MVLNEYNTSIYENRFLVGSVVEVFTMAMMRACGIKVNSCGETGTATDLKLSNGAELSIKSQFTKRRGNIKLINTQSSSEVQWNAATIFIIAGIGIVYGDPEIVDEEDIQRKSDSLELRFSGIDSFIQNPSFRIEVDVPFKPDKEMIASSKKASTAVIKEIAVGNKLNILESHLD